MRIGFISVRRIKNFSSLEDRVRERGHEITLLPFNEVELDEHNIEALVDRCAQYDVLHYYAGFGDVIGTAIGEALEKRGVPVVNNSANLSPYVENKIYQTLVCNQAGIPTPKSIRAFRPDFDTLAEWLGVPFLAKKPRGTHGAEVHLIDTPNALATLSLPGEYLYQEFIPHKNDFRVHVVGGKHAFCLYKRVPAAGNFKANVSLGATMEAVTDAEERAAVTDIALRAAKEMRCDLCGVDVFRSEKDGKYRIIEINRNPGWKDVNAVTGESFEDTLIDYYESVCPA